MLQRMSQGGIYDHLGGGYSRYSTDAVWLVPHFEKMLYDNAQLLELLALAHAAPPDPALRRARRRDRRLDDPRHDRATGRMAERRASPPRKTPTARARKAVSTSGPKPEIDALLGADAPAFKRCLRRDAGRQLGRPYHPAPRHPGRVRRDEAAALARARNVLFEARAQRVRPGRDDKVLADWNGLAVAALARAAAVFDQPEWLARAGQAFDFVLAQMGAPDGRVQHAWRLGPRHRRRSAGRPGGDGPRRAGAVRSDRRCGAPGPGRTHRCARQRKNSPTATAGSTPPPTTPPTCRWPARAPRRTTPPPPAPA